MDLATRYGGGRRVLNRALNRSRAALGKQFGGKEERGSQDRGAREELGSLFFQ